MGAAASKREVKATVSYPSVSYPSVARASIAPLRESELGKSHAEEPPSRRKSREGSAALVDELVARERINLLLDPGSPFLELSQETFSGIFSIG